MVPPRRCFSACCVAKALLRTARLAKSVDEHRAQQDAGVRENSRAGPIDALIATKFDSTPDCPCSRNGRSRPGTPFKIRVGCPERHCRAPLPPLSRGRPGWPRTVGTVCHQPVPETERGYPPGFRSTCRPSSTANETRDRDSDSADRHGKIRCPAHGRLRARLTSRETDDEFRARDSRQSDSDGTSGTYFPPIVIISSRFLGSRFYMWVSLTQSTFGNVDLRQDSC